jgi:hypothetical protein
MAQLKRIQGGTRSLHMTHQVILPSLGTAPNGRASPRRGSVSCPAGSLGGVVEEGVWSGWVHSGQMLHCGPVAELPRVVVAELDRVADGVGSVEFSTPLWRLVVMLAGMWDR